jgi:thiaminase
VFQRLHTILLTHLSAHGPWERYVQAFHSGDHITGLIYWLQAFVDVWTYIQKNQANKPNKIPQLQEIIDYWADPSYVAAIDETGDLINTWWGGKPWPKTADSVFLDTLQHEADFWVSVDSMGKN